jgi:RecA-family ATPase
VLLSCDMAFHWWEDIPKLPRVEQPFLIHPYIPMQGVVFLHGKAGWGKTPFTWAIARAVGTGQPFFGHYTRQGRVLYIENDTPEMPYIETRLRFVPPAPNVGFAMVRAFNVLQQPADPVVRELGSYHREINPDLVIINTLRKLHTEKDTESHVPSRVYTALQSTFPGSALLIVHHDKKDLPDGNSGLEDEKFSGSQAWRNDATTALHLIALKKAIFGKPLPLMLEHTKSQVSAQYPALHLTLEADGYTLVSREEQTKQLHAKLDNMPDDMTKRDKVAQAAKDLGVSESTIWRALRDTTAD